MVKFYQVGGSVRDELLGTKSKDLDYVCVCSSYDEMRQAVLSKGGKIHIEKPEYLTIRGMIPGLGDADFVMARKDGAYYDGRRPENVEPGTLEDDIKRRDFTINSIAKDCDTGEIIDMVGGLYDLSERLIRCVGNPSDRFNEDGLRILRAIRFAITKNFDIGRDIHNFFIFNDTTKLLSGVSQERIREELLKMLKCNTVRTVKLLSYYNLFDFLFTNNGIWLKPTTES